uniref:Laminin subunit beta-1 n=1 Tax=Strigamia maritima TaxID=126957 RepID=T1IRE1_STRMM
MGPPTWIYHFTLTSVLILGLIICLQVKGEISGQRRKSDPREEYRVSQGKGRIKNKDDLTLSEFLSDQPRQDRQDRKHRTHHQRRHSTPRTRHLEDVDHGGSRHRQEQTNYRHRQEQTNYRHRQEQTHYRQTETHHRETHRHSGQQQPETVTSHYSRTVWANRSYATGSYFERHRPTTQRSRYPTPLPVESSVDPCDELLHREDIYGKYSPGDILDLGLDPHGCLEFNMTLPEDPIHPLTRWYNPSGSQVGPYRIPESCDYSQCYPVTGDLLIGRESMLGATSTCGLYTKERFCIVSHLEDKKKCFHCDSREHNLARGQSHRIENIVYRLESRKKTWWQSESGKEQVSIQLDLEAEFHFTHLIIKFKTFRPAAMFIERSQDHGLTWQVYRYFAYDCAESFPGIPRGPPRSISDVICESRYSEVAPSTRGELIYRVLPPNFRNYDPWSGEVQNLLKMTNLRINFTRLHTLGDNLLDQRNEIKEKYYYAIYNMVVRGSCSCYGHASQCDPINPDKKYPKEMVHGRCNCTHFTTGLNCEKCMDFFNDLPWKPANGTQTNACKRCNCHEHADRCHFDAAIFAATGNSSGGVCDECQHNTMGRQCEMCKHFYYRDYSRDMTDPYACLPCDCDPRGSLDNGICDSISDQEYHLEAGRCYCKANVQGRRCDRCQDGYWNFQESNHNGCDACTCHPLGTVSGIGCNQYSGECTCKRYVTGRDCNQCMPEHWGLSDDRDGCHPCDCDPGGAFDNNCDVISGQCRCRAHVTGRACDRPDTGYFAGLLDYYVYEAELARGCDNCDVIVREPWSDREASWTGIGFMRGYEGSKIEFDVSNIQRTMDYDIVIRYEPQLPRTWEEAHIIIERPGPVDRNDKCAGVVSHDDFKRAQLHSGNRDVIVFPPVCLERGRNYKIILELKRYDTHVDTPTATILIDSIALIPRVESIPFFQDTTRNEHRRQEFERFRCGQAFSSVIKPTLPEICKKYLISIGFYVYEEALECNCDPTGSTSAICDNLGGQCSCKSHVVGRRCDRCAPGTYGFSPSGCRACDCDSVGSQDNFCDGHSGQCKCRQNTYGRQCDECQPGFWNYPTCIRCECNGHADTCDSRTGHCLDCRDFSVGNQCEGCLTGYYGDPRIGINIPCRACQCPGLKDSGHSYADTCYLDNHLHTVVCNCPEGYAGERCDRCANNYYGNPDTPGGRCESCNCNSNIDVLRPGNCDARSGECKQCLFNTEGFYCDRCKAGFFGDAVEQLCQECVCNFLGVDPQAGACNRITGQCPCLPNVIGQKCDECERNHWKLASGEGCEACDCDAYGSHSDQCNEYDGQCECKPGYGGRRCNECQQNYWGNPNVECFACNCDQAGSTSLQCHRNNGSCICQEGIGGERCDKCARGYIGKAPYCDPCGECFDNWDLTINNLRDETYRLIEVAKRINQTGLDLQKNQKYYKEVDTEVDDTTNRISEAKYQLDDLKIKAKQVEKEANDLKNEARILQEADVDGALNITRDAHRRSQIAQAKVDGLERSIELSKHERKRTENIIEKGESHFNRTFMENEASLSEVVSMFI